MASKGLSSSIYQVARNNIGSNKVRISRIPLFAIPIVSTSTVCLVRNLIFEYLYIKKNTNGNKKIYSNNC